jgi:hypothetical protein
MVFLEESEGILSECLILESGFLPPNGGGGAGVRSRGSGTVSLSSCSSETGFWTGFDSEGFFCESSGDSSPGSENSGRLDIF